MSTTLTSLVSDLAALATVPHAQVHPRDLAVRAEGSGFRIDYSPVVWSRQDEQRAFVEVRKHLVARNWTLANPGGYLFAR